VLGIDAIQPQNVRIALQTELLLKCTDRSHAFDDDETVTRRLCPGSGAGGHGLTRRGTAE
jgi:hypothetical protein